jgi:hypothetical protein
MPVPAEISQLLELFERNIDQYRAPAFTEAALQRRIEMTDRQIDALVYELYELTPEEIKVVEGAADEIGQADGHAFGASPAPGGDAAAQTAALAQHGRGRAAARARKV